MFSHEYWKGHSFNDLHSKGYSGLIKGNYYFKSHEFQRIKYHCYPSFVVNDYFHRNRINSVKLRSTSVLICKKRVSERSKYPIRDNEIFKINNRINANRRRDNKREYIWWDDD